MTKPNKYHAVKTKLDGITFHSKGEAGRYEELKLLEKSGRITHLKLQRAFPLFAGKNKYRQEIGSYIADFEYWDFDAEAWVAEEYKGFRTALYKWKVKHFKAEYPQYLFRETSARRTSGEWVKRGRGWTSIKTS